MRFSKEPPHLSSRRFDQGSPELVDQGVVGGEQLDPVEAGRLGPPGGLAEGLDDLLDLGSLMAWLPSES